MMDTKLKEVVLVNDGHVMAWRILCEVVHKCLAVLCWCWIAAVAYNITACWTIYRKVPDKLKYADSMAEIKSCSIW